MRRREDGVRKGERGEKERGWVEKGGERGNNWQVGIDYLSNKCDTQHTVDFCYLLNYSEYWTS